MSTAYWKCKTSFLHLILIKKGSNINPKGLQYKPFEAFDWCRALSHVQGRSFPIKLNCLSRRHIVNLTWQYIHSDADEQVSVCDPQVRQSRLTTQNSNSGQIPPIKKAKPSRISIFKLQVARFVIIIFFQGITESSVFYLRKKDKNQVSGKQKGRPANNTFWSFKCKTD